LVGRDAEVDDIVQEVFLQAMRGFSQIRDPQALKAWLATVTVRIARRRLQFRKFKAWVGMDDDPGYDCVASSAASPEQRALLSRVYSVLDQIPIDQRLAWTLRTVEGEQVETVASMCGCSLATAKRRIAAAQDRIERDLCDE
jgi:RNA polymerase sigma-70 factor (ECF subfamily)